MLRNVNRKQDLALRGAVQAQIGHRLARSRACHGDAVSRVPLDGVHRGVGGAVGGLGAGTYKGVEADANYKSAFRNCMRNRGHNVID